MNKKKFLVFGIISMLVATSFLTFNAVADPNEDNLEFLKISNSDLNDIFSALDEIKDKELSKSLVNVIENSIHLHHPKNMGHQVVPPVPMAALVELISALLNNSMAIYEVGPFSSTI